MPLSPQIFINMLKHSFCFNAENLNIFSGPTCWQTAFKQIYTMYSQGSHSVFKSIFDQLSVVISQKTKYTIGSLKALPFQHCFKIQIRPLESPQIGVFLHLPWFVLPLSQHTLTVMDVILFDLKFHLISPPLKYLTALPTTTLNFGILYTCFVVIRSSENKLFDHTLWSTAAVHFTLKAATTCWPCVGVFSSLIFRSYFPLPLCLQLGVGRPVQCCIVWPIFVIHTS